MIKNIIFLSLAFVTCLPLFSQNKEASIIELPLIWHDGYGSFEQGLFGIGFRLEETKLKGIPADWKETQIGYIETDRYQLEYQNFHTGKISADNYEWMQKVWKWTPDSTRLSKTPMKCEIGLAIGKSADGQIWMLVDQNNNGDLSDDIPFIPAARLEEYIKNPNELLKYAFPVEYEKLQEGKIVNARTLMLICDAGDGRYAFNFPQYATARLNGRLIGAHGRGSLSYKDTEIALMYDDDEKLKKRIEWTALICLNEYLTVDKVCYKNLGIDPNRNVLRLQRIEVPATQLTSTQVGFRTIDFAGTNYKTKAELTLEAYRGKYVFLEFWSQTCGACLREMPNLKRLYGLVDKDKMEFVGIIGDSSVSAIDRIMEKYDITWPQILSDEATQIDQKYGIVARPTTFLINPDGVIIGKNLLSQGLEKEMKETGLFK